MPNKSGPEEVAEEIKAALDGDDTATGEDGEIYVLESGKVVAVVCKGDN